MNHLVLAQKALQDNSALCSKITKSTDCQEFEVEILLTEVIRFMHLTTLANERLTPSHIVDLAWHEFILFTKYYADFCQEHFNKFIHHHPGGHEQANKLNFKKTHYYYKKYFQIVPEPKYWGTILAEIADESDCGV